MAWYQLIWGGAMNTVGEKVVGLVGGVFSHASSVINLISSLQEETDKLRRTMERIGATLTDAEQRRNVENEKVKLWLRELKGAYFDADAILDHYRTHLSIYKTNNNSRKRKRGLAPSISSDFSALLQKREFATQISKIKQRLDEIYEDRKKYALKEKGKAKKHENTSKMRNFSKQGASHDPNQTIGRDNQKIELVRELTSTESRIHLPVVAVYGSSGIGKTTLAQLAFRDPEVLIYFDWRIWVCLSDGSSVAKATKEIIEAVTEEKCDALSLDILQQRLRKHLTSRRFLLVIDNLWEEHYQFWETLRVPLLSGQNGSKILITTRNERVLMPMTRSLTIHLKGLENKDCLRLLLNRAMPRKDYTHYETIVKIGEAIVEKCGGSPTAANSLGVLLHNKDVEEWKSILNEMRVLEDNENILPSLQISYHHLPYHLKQCFVYCSIFPSGYEFDKNEIVRLWLAEGLIPCGGRRRWEAEGNTYFDELLLRSFFEVSSDDQNKKLKYKMPNLMYDLSRFVCKYEFVNLERSTSDGDLKSKRYGSLYYRNMNEFEFDNISRHENLRTLKLCGDFRLPIKHMPTEVVTKLRCLRALDMSFSELEELPASIGNMIHLRYLNLSNTRVQMLPDSVTDLFNLQTLELGNCYRLLELPREMVKLVNLRHLGLHLDWDRVTSDLKSMPPGIGQLTSLQTLSRFIVTCEDDNNDAEQGCKINEIRDLNLHGELCFLNLENVENPQDAKEANLLGKEFIEKLMLRWSYDMVTSGSEAVMESLRPHNNIRCIRIDGYPGKILPLWFRYNSYSYLQNLRLSYCSNCEELPSWGNFPRLKNLRIEGLHGVKSMGRMASFPALEVLTIWHMCNLEKWFEVETVEMPELRQLCISHCDNLKELSPLPNAISKLEIRNCSELLNLDELPSLHELIVVESNERIIDWISCLTSLSSLNLTLFRNVSIIPGSSLQNLVSLKKLKIGGFDKLTSLGGNFNLRELTSLEFLEVSSCLELAEFSSNELPPNLKDFRILSCYKLRKIPLGLKNLALLQRLEIRDLPVLQSMMEDILPDNLSYLALSGCVPQERWCRVDVGLRPVIRRIRNVEVGFRMIETCNT
ncbi:hypothetical protein LUZ60_013200 [Juncus effusus]|nr:hypothetical protein LUZ60_013200 [Juncus effusus]